MELFIFIFEIIGTAAFAVSGAMTGVAKKMDIFGVCILGLTTATGGGMIRDVVLGVTPPAAFRDPVYAVISIAVSVVVFFVFRRHKTMHEGKGCLLYTSPVICLSSRIRSAISLSLFSIAFTMPFFASLVTLVARRLQESVNSSLPFLSPARGNCVP